eukprot:TRINITY_DN5819_c0_g2_i1.p1 TRINITY_DN5819_c0_g2~~TRINITY_DN5819_c0_g2_i1.p1  ORF type:complete len:181 (+),score=32.52 TRINITY_DN5819_c0_g2_i1:42-545(+)
MEEQEEQEDSSSLSPRSSLSRSSMRRKESTLVSMQAVKKILEKGEAPDMVAGPLMVQEAGERCDILTDECRQHDVARWAYIALQEGRIFSFNSRMRRLELELPAALEHKRDQDAEKSEARMSVLDHRQRAMASVVLHALTDPSTNRRHQLEDIYSGTGAIRIPPKKP